MGDSSIIKLVSTGNGYLVAENGGWTVYSYNTCVYRVFIADGHVWALRLWSGWSRTTASHVRKACKIIGVSYPTKAEWYSMALNVVRMID